MARKKKRKPHYWLIRAFKQPDKVVFAATEKEAKSLSGYKGRRGHAAYPIQCEAACHEYVTGDEWRRHHADTKGPMEQLVCKACDEYLRKDQEARIYELEQAVVELRRNVQDLWGEL